MDENVDFFDCIEYIKFIWLQTNAKLNNYPPR